VNKATTAKLFSAAAVASAAALGMAAAPATASAASPPATTGSEAAAAVPSAGRTHPSATFKPAGERHRLQWHRVKLSPQQRRELARAAEAATPVAPTRTPGFVPRPSRGVVPVSSPEVIRPDTETGCSSSGYVCLGLYGGGTYVSYVNTSWTKGTGCHIGHIIVQEPGQPQTNFSSPGYICKNQEYSIDFYSYFQKGTLFCGSFNNIPPGKVPGTYLMCESVR
jgi:hypothetical protein